MSLEQMRADLDQITKCPEELSEASVAVATSILARPRYADSPNPAALLVKDLEDVIAAIPNFDPPPGRPAAESSSYNFRSYARRYFSLDEGGTTLTHRRAFGAGKEPAGSEGAWMSRGVLWRVASGLLDLEARGGSSTASSGPPGAYRIETLRVAGRFHPNLPLTGNRPRRRRFLRYTLTLQYTIRLVEPGPGCSLDLPLPLRHTKLLGAPRGQGFGWREVHRGLRTDRVPTVWFGRGVPGDAQPKPGDLVQLTIQRRPLARNVQ